MRQIVDEAILLSPDSNIIVDQTSPTVTIPPTGSTKIPEPAPSGGDFQEIGHEEASQEERDEQQVLGPKLPLSQDKASSTAESPKIDLSALIAPEVWADLMPVKTGPDPIDQEDTALLAAVASTIPPPPKDDTVTFLNSKTPNKLKILSAICGIHDVTQTIQDRVKDDTSLTIPISEIASLTRDSSAYGLVPKPYIKSLSFIYQYGDGPLRLCSAVYDEQSTDSIQISTSNSSQHAEVRGRPWNKESWSLIATVLGGSIVRTNDLLKGFEDQIRLNFNANSEAQRRLTMSPEAFGISSAGGTSPTRIGVVFFKSAENGPVRAAAAIEGQTCTLSDQQQLAELTRETVKEIIKEVPQEKLNEIRRGGEPRRKSTSI